MSIPVHIYFFEPFRLSDRLGDSYANWVKSLQGDLGRPQITGSLLRSTVSEVVENLLWLHQGAWQEHKCCNGHFSSSAGRKQKRRRQTLKWPADQAECTENSPCLFCLFQGVNGQRQVRFSNLYSSEFYERVEDVGERRVINRLDPLTGKAFDYTEIFEIDGVRELLGTIEILDSIDEKKRTALELLLQAALSQVDILSGAACRIRTTEPASCEQFKPVPPLSTANQAAISAVSAAVEKEGLSPEKIRLLADAILLLRGESPDQIPLLPKGVPDKEKFKPHYLYDAALKGINLRSILEDRAADLENDPQTWQRFCESLGLALYRRSKEGARAVSTGLVIEEPAYTPKTRDDILPTDRTSHGGYTHELVITGRLRALSPFFLGSEAGSEQQHTDLQLLTTRHGVFRLPHSALRGALREYLDLASGGKGCVKEMGGKNACLCPVCQIMHQVAMPDSLCDESLPETLRVLPPDIRQRIRRNPVTNTVDEAALFNQEAAPEGLFFPFFMRYRGGMQFPSILRLALSWWQEGNLFLGGASGTDKGNFVLENLEVRRWSFIDDRDYAAWTAPVKDPVPFDSKKEGFPWRRFTLGLAFEGPVLNSDPILALMPRRENDPGTDPNAVFFRKTVVAQGDNGQYEARRLVAIKSETMRGLLRNAVGKHHDLLAKSHEECRCLLCRLFGNEHQRGLLRIGDVTVVGSEAGRTKLLDHVSSSRFNSQVVQKFNDQPLVGSPDNPLRFTGAIWCHERVLVDDDLRTTVVEALANIHAGLHPVGGKVGIGYGVVTDLEICGQEQLQLPPAAVLVASHTPTEAARRSPVDAQSLALHLSPDRLYSPHYFIKPPEERRKNGTFRPKNVLREKQWVSHARFAPDRFTGRLTCTLTTKTPLIIPDTEADDFFGLQAVTPGHKNHGFFRLGETVMLPGAPLRAMVSQVFETLTNSCYRVMDLKEHLSWRMDASPDTLNQYSPGRIVVDDSGRWFVEPVDDYRLPLYDDLTFTTTLPTDPAVVAERQKLENRANRAEDDLALARRKTPPDAGEIRTLQEKAGKARREVTKFDNVVNTTNITIATAAQTNITYLENLKATDKKKWKQVIEGKLPVKITQPQRVNPGNQYDQIVTINDQGHLEGYLKITGLNNANVVNGSTGAACIPLNWRTERLSIRLQAMKMLPSPKKRLFPRPALITEVGNHGEEKTYTANKRCERVFVPKTNGEQIPLTAANREHYKTILKKYEKYRENIDEAFRTIIPNDQELSPGDLVYFKRNGDTVEQLIPVRISREMDLLPIGTKLPNATYRPCAHVCLEECEQCSPNSCGLELYREGRILQGLCPACHLFGTAGYQGRVRFGFATLAGEEMWQSGPGNAKHLTLPLQEAPRPTWVLSDPKKKIPGRKFYVHHHGWKEVVAGREILNRSQIEPTKNNCSFETLAPANTFTFQIHFENLAEWELGLLLYSLELEPGLAHKLGRGKAFGFGSVTVAVDKMELYQPTTQTWQEEGTNGWIETGLAKLDGDFSSTPDTRPWLEQLRKALCFEGINEEIKVCYPPLEKTDVSENGQTRHIDGYIQLKERNHNANQHLATIWDPWWTA